MERRLSGRQIVAIVVSICTAVVLAPVAAIAATSLVTIADATTGSRARVDSGKVRVGDGSGAVTVDGTVNTRDLGANAVVYKSPAGGLNCGANAAGVTVGTFNLSKYSRLRFDVKSGNGYQTIIQLRAKAGSEVMLEPVFDWTVSAGQYGHTLFYDPPTSGDLIVYFCNQAQIFVYGLR